MPSDASAAVEAGARIALVEDDDVLRDDILVPGLRACGHQVEGFRSPRELYRRLLAASFDVAVLDVGLPGEDGLSVARHLRTGSPIGIVMLTGRSRRDERLRALGEAADAWLSKPVEVEIIAATIGSLLRRMRMPLAPAVLRPSSRWHLSANGWHLHGPSGEGVELTRAERLLLETLAAAAGEPVPRERLTAALGGDDHDFDPHRIEMVVHRLRRKVAERFGTALPLRSVRGHGYVLLDSENEAPE